MRTIAALCLCGLLRAGDFVLIHGGSFRMGSTQMRVDDFEMLDHPVTNAEYAAFVRASGHRAPQYWKQGQIPLGMDQWPVIYVNREDAGAYVAWRTKKEDRIYRLSTVSEFEYAARAGQADATYPWGNKPPEGHAKLRSRRVSHLCAVA